MPWKQKWDSMCSHRARVLCSLCAESAIGSWTNTGRQEFVFCFIRKIDPPAMSASWCHAHPGRLKGQQDSMGRGSNLLIAWVLHIDFRITPCVKIESPMTPVARYSPVPFLGHLFFLLSPFLCLPQQLTCFRKILNLTCLLWEEITPSVSHDYSTRSFPAGEVQWLGWRTEESCLILPSLSGLYIYHHQHESITMPQAPFPAKDIINPCQDFFFCHCRFAEWTFKSFFIANFTFYHLLIYSDHLFGLFWAWDEHPIWNLKQQQALCPVSAKSRQDWGRHSAREARQKGSKSSKSSTAIPAGILGGRNTQKHVYHFLGAV